MTAISIAGGTLQLRLPHLVGAGSVTKGAYDGRGKVVWTPSFLIRWRRVLG